MNIDTSIQGHLLNIFLQLEKSQPSNLVAAVRRRGGGAAGAGGDEDGGAGADGAGDGGVGGADALAGTWRERQQGIGKKRYLQRESREPFKKHIAKNHLPVVSVVVSL